MVDCASLGKLQSTRFSRELGEVYWDILGHIGIHYQNNKLTDGIIEA